jgi:hypothetical protein
MTLATSSSANSDPDRAQKPSRGLEPAVQREQHLIAILAVGLPQVTEFDEMVDKRFGQVDGNATNPSRWRRRNRYTRRPAPSSTRPRADTAAPPASNSRRCAIRCACATAMDAGDVVNERRVCPRLKSMSASRLYDLLLYDQRGEPIERFQLVTSQIGKQQLLVHYPHWRFRISTVYEALPVTAGNFRHDPLPDAGADLAVSRIKLTIVGYIHDLISPKIHEEKTRGAVAVAEAVDITDGPATDRAFAGHIDIAADGPQALAFCHSIANNITKITGVIRLCHCLDPHAILREYSIFRRR